jgi:hypothetical protein
MQMLNRDVLGVIVKFCNLDTIVRLKLSSKFMKNIVDKNVSKKIAVQLAWLKFYGENTHLLSSLQANYNKWFPLKFISFYYNRMKYEHQQNWLRYFCMKYIYENRIPTIDEIQKHDWQIIFKQYGLPHDFFSIPNINIYTISKTHFVKYLDFNKINYFDIKPNSDDDRYFRKTIVRFSYANNNFTYIEKYINYFLLENVPVELFDKYSGKLHWPTICLNTYLPIWFFEKHFDKLDWNSISINPSIPIHFYESNLNKIVWKHIVRNTNVPVWFYEKYINKLNKLRWKLLCKNKSVPVEFYEKHIDFVHWKLICYHPGLPVSFFEKYYDRLKSKRALSLNPGVSLQFLIAHPECIDTKLIFTYFNRFESPEFYKTVAGPAFKADILSIEHNHQCYSVPKHYDTLTDNIDDYRRICYNPTYHSSFAIF